MSPHQSRVLEEKTELDTKLLKLQAFLQTVLFYSLPLAEQYRMKRQENLMREYSNVLTERIAAFAP